MSFAEADAVVYTSCMNEKFKETVENHPTVKYFIPVSTEKLSYLHSEKVKEFDDIVALGHHLRALHFNDNRGHGDEHIMPYLGTMSVDEVMCGLRDIDYRGDFTFECDSSLRSANCWQGNTHLYKYELKNKNAKIKVVAIDRFGNEYTETEITEGTDYTYTSGDYKTDVNLK